MNEYIFYYIFVEKIKVKEFNSTTKEFNERDSYFKENNTIRVISATNAKEAMKVFLEKSEKDNTIVRNITDIKKL